MNDRRKIISSKADLMEYLEADRKALGKKKRRPKPTEFVWRFQIALRYLEYYSNVNKHTICHKIAKLYWKLLYTKYSLICGFEIPINVFGKGLSIAHKGTIVVNGNARVGDNCRLHTCVNIGTAPGANGLAPLIGEGAYIGPGAKLWGRITIGDDVVIGANACVGKDFPSSVCIAGSPARVIKVIGRGELEKVNRNIESNVIR